MDRLRRTPPSLELQPQRLRLPQPQRLRRPQLLRLHRLRLRLPTPTPTATPTIQVTVQTNLAGLTFTVDNITYSSTQTFSWVPGSSHTIGTTSPQNGATGVQYVWTNWTGGGAISHTVAPTTNTDLHSQFQTQYYLTMSHGTGGTVSPASGWKNSGAAVSISATAATGYSFGNLDR